MKIVACSVGGPSGSAEVGGVMAALDVDDEGATSAAPAGTAEVAACMMHTSHRG